MEGKGDGGDYDTTVYTRFSKLSGARIGKGRIFGDSRAIDWLPH